MRMTLFDIRIRRKQFVQSRIERHTDFQNLVGNYDRTSRKKTRGIMILVFLLIMIMAILLTFYEALHDVDEQKGKIGNLEKQIETPIQFDLQKLL